MDYTNECSLVRDRAVYAAREEIRLFCRILGYPNNDLNHLIGDDPHGIVDMQEGYRYFNMTDIHVLIADYARWLVIYKDNQTLRKVVDEWYYWTLENHDPRKNEWQEDFLEEGRTILGWFNGVYKICQLRDGELWECDGGLYEGDDSWTSLTKLPKEVADNLEKYRYLRRPDKHRYCNLKNWLMGWRPKPEDCLPYYNEHQAQEQAEAHARTEQAKADLNKAADEFNENKPY